MTASSPAPHDVAARYERLRRAALGDAVESTDRIGLTLLLRRGLWAWARAIALPPPAAPPCSATAGPLVSHDRRPDLARLLAGMALAHTPTASAPP